MPLDEFQKGIATVLSACRDSVSRRQEGHATLQWTHGLGLEFYDPVPDNQFGYRLHFADLATNKALAAATRIVMRDFLDLWMLDRHVLPLWRTLCAAPGKDADFNPLSLTQRISFNWHVAKANDREGYEALIDISPDDVGPSLLDSLHEATLILGDMPADQYGRLQVGRRGQPVLSRECGLDGHWIRPRPSGALPSFEGADSEMIAGLIAEYGPEGSRFTMDDNDTDCGP